ILDGTSPPVVTIAGANTGLGGGFANEGAPVTFTVSLDKVSTASTTIEVLVSSKAGNTATEGADYANGTYTVVIPAGQTTGSFTVATVDDAVLEGNESFSAEIISATNTVGTITVNATPATGTIIDNDTPTVTVTGTNTGAGGGFATEGAPVTFTVSLDKVSTVATTIDVLVSSNPGNTATAGADYANGTYTVTIPAGQTSGSFTVATVDDAVIEGSETFSAEIVSARNAVGTIFVNAAPATGTIIDNDFNTPPVADPVLTAVDPTPSGLASGLGNVVFFKALNVGGGLDGDINVFETNPADLGGQDAQTPESGLIFTLTSLPNYGSVYIDYANNSPTGGDWIKVTAANIATQTFTTADKIYWVATSADPVPGGGTGATHTIGGIGANQAAWEQFGVEISALKLNGSAGTLVFDADGAGVAGGIASAAGQINYDIATKTTEKFVVDFGHAVKSAAITVTHLIPDESGGEVGVVTAMLNGVEVGSWTFSRTGSPGSGADITFSVGTVNGVPGQGAFTIPGNITYDKLVFSAKQYVTQGSGTDSSDYYLAKITYTDATTPPESVTFNYQVTDADGSSSAAVPVIIMTEHPDGATGTVGTTTSVAEDGQATQHIAAPGSLPAAQPATVSFQNAFTAGDNEAITGVTVANIPTGAAVMIGGAPVTNGTPLTAAQLAAWIGGTAMTVMPPANSDTDFSLKLTMNLTDPDSGHTGTVTGDINIVVDAIADKPTSVSATPNPTVSITSSSKSDDDDDDDHTTPPANDGSIVVGGTNFGLKLSATFGDHLDGSEKHFFLVKVPDASWAPSGSTVVNNPDGVPAGTYVKINADSLINHTTGQANVDITLKAPGSSTASYQAVSFPVHAVAEEVDETTPKTGELAGNNISVTSTVVDVDIATGNKILIGNSYTNTLSGGSGHDVLIGAGGNDILTGGGGNDVFVFRSTSEGIDTITDYKNNAGEKDVLNIADILEGTGAAQNNIANFVKVNASNGSVTVDPTGHGGGTQIAKLNGISAGNEVKLIVDHLGTEVTVTII
ncbi:MAG: hypothetical protein FD165_2763, partial [Gammaproteobacteria bacterium]